MDLRLAGEPPSPWEAVYGYSRVVRQGPLVVIGGTTSVSEDGAVIGLTPYDQAVEILGKVVRELGRVGASVADVVQTRIYVTDISRAEEVLRAFAEVLGPARGVASMVEVARLIDERMLVEIEVMAWCGGSGPVAAGARPSGS